MLNLHLLECTVKGYDHISDLLLAKYWVITDCKYCSCTGLTSVVIPESVTEIGEYAFYGCTGLTSIKVPAGKGSHFKKLLNDEDLAKLVVEFEP